MYKWDISKFAPVPHNFRESISTQRVFMDDLTKKLNITDQDGLYTLTAATIQHHGGSKLLRQFKNSPSALLATIYPEYQWDPTKFKSVPKNYWDSPSSQLSFMNQILSTMKVDPNEPVWNYLTHKILREHGGNGLLVGKYDGSVSKLLSSLYPEYKTACTEWIMNIVREKQFEKVEEILNVPMKYVWICSYAHNCSYLKQKGGRLLEQHDHSVVKRK